MADPSRLAKHLDHVVVPEAVERVPAVVAGDRETDAAGRELVQQRDTTPARRAAGHAILQVEVAHRKTDHADVSLGDAIERLGDYIRGLDGQATAVTAHDAAGEPSAERGARQMRQRPRSDVAALV